MQQLEQPETGRQPGGNHSEDSDDAKGITQIKEWYNRFKDSCTLVDSESCSGQPSTSRNDQIIAKVNVVMIRKHHGTIREVVE